MSQLWAENIAGAFYFAARVVNVSTKAAQAATLLAVAGRARCCCVPALEVPLCAPLIFVKARAE